MMDSENISPVNIQPVSIPGVGVKVADTG